MKKASRPEEPRQTDTSSSLRGTTDPSLPTTAVHMGRHTTRHLRAVYACHPKKRPRPNNAGGNPWLSAQWIHRGRGISPDFENRRQRKKQKQEP